MRADDRAVVDPSARGRDSVRISSQNTYDEAIIVLDLKHMPAGCATWPAFRTKTQAGPSPPGAVVDIIEGTSQSHSCLVFLYHSPRMLLLCRCQFEQGKPSHFAHCPKLHNSV